MEKIAVFVNDAAYARHLLQPMLQSGAPTQWVLVACAPTLTRHIGRWVSHAAREQWRQRWAAELFTELELTFKSGGSSLEKIVAKRPLEEVSKRLQARLGNLRVLDARRPRLGQADEPITATQPPMEANRWATPVAAMTGMSAMLSLAD
jgi:hypothetical protein